MNMINTEEIQLMVNNESLVMVSQLLFIFGPSVLRAPAEQTKVATVLGIFPLFLLVLPPLFKTTEGVVVLFQIFAWAPKKK